tara:strand:+ start:748 stop:1185 length:438 start_codon:yes stop_codon:yes gene_type:complete
MKITKQKLKQIIREELNNAISYAGTQMYIKESRVLEDGKTLETLVEEEFQVWLEEEKAKATKFQPGLGAGGNVGISDTYRSIVFYKVRKRLMQDYGFLDAVDAYRLDRDGEQYDKEEVIDVGKPIWKEIYNILYKLIPRHRLHGL